MTRYLLTGPSLVHDADKLQEVAAWRADVRDLRPETKQAPAAWRLGLGGREDCLPRGRRLGDDNPIDGPTLTREPDTNLTASLIASGRRPHPPKTG